MIASALLKDVDLIFNDSMVNTIDASNIRPERWKFCESFQERNAESENVWGLYFDGRKD